MNINLLKIQEMINLIKEEMGDMKILLLELKNIWNLKIHWTWLITDTAEEKATKIKHTATETDRQKHQ